MNDQANNQANEPEADDLNPGKALGCYGCCRVFDTPAELDAHEQATGHGPGDDQPKR